MMISKFGFPTTPGLDYRPWRVVEKRIGKLDIKEYFLGSMFLASSSTVKIIHKTLPCGGVRNRYGKRELNKWHDYHVEI